MYRTMRYLLVAMAIVLLLSIGLVGALYALSANLPGDLAGNGPRLLWSGSYASNNRPDDTSGSARYRYLLFNGRERNTLMLTAGQTLAFDYRADVNYGEIAFRLEKPDGQAVWEEKLGASVAKTASVPVAENGLYALIVRGQNAGGSYELAWRANSN